MGDAIPLGMDRYVTLVTGTVQKPMWASGPQARRWQTVMGVELDELIDAFRDARAVRYPSQTPSDALYLLRTRGLTTPGWDTPHNTPLPRLPQGRCGMVY